MDSCFLSELPQLLLPTFVDCLGRPLLQESQRNRFVNRWPSATRQKQRKQHNTNGGCQRAGIRTLCVKTTNSRCDHPQNFAAAGSALLRVERDESSPIELECSTLSRACSGCKSSRPASLRCAWRARAFQRRRSGRYDSRVDALSIIPDAQLEQTSAIPDIRFDIASLCVAESISYRLTSNRVDFVPQRFRSNSRLKAYSDVTTRPVIAGGPLRQGARAELDGSAAERAPSTENAARYTIHGLLPPKPMA